jgi:hypothetical protein
METFIAKESDPAFAGALMLLTSLYLQGIEDVDEAVRIAKLGLDEAAKTLKAGIAAHEG